MNVEPGSNLSSGRLVVTRTNRRTDGGGHRRDLPAFADALKKPSKSPEVSTRRTFRARWSKPSLTMSTSLTREGQNATVIEVRPAEEKLR